MPTLTIPQTENLCMQILTKAGISQKDAALLFDSMLIPSLRGHDSHGIRRVPIVADQTMKGAEAAEGEPVIIKESAATAAIDARWNPGPIVGMMSTKIAIEKAKKMGVSAVTVMRSMSMAAIGYFVEPIAQADMIGIMWSRVSIPSAPPYGGAGKVFGTHPFAYAVPTGSGRPILVDMSTTAIAAQAMAPLMASGLPLPPGLALDEDGMPTTDPARFGVGLNRVGTFASMGGGPKGYAMQLMVDLLSGPLSGMDWAEIPIAIRRTGNQSLTIAIDIAHFMDVGLFKSRLDDKLKTIKNSKRAKGFDEIFIPGERSFRTEAKRRAGGIPVSDRDWQTFEDICKQLNIDVAEAIKA